jgi:dihydropteroate synthase
MADKQNKKNKRTLTKPEEIKRVIPLADGRQLPLSRPLVMGILNTTPDSFSDGGRYDTAAAAISRARQMEREGADIIDIGGESTRPGAKPIDADEELRRVLPVIEVVARETDLCISIDTYRASTAAAAIDAGAVIVNDISALRSDPDMARVVAEKNVPVILMHMKGRPHDMQESPRYDNCVAEIDEFFEESIRFSGEHGIDKGKLILDPGIGFGKRLSDNLEVLGGLASFKRHKLPLLVGASRKSFIEMLAPSSSPADKRLGGSIAAAVVSVLNGADIVRVHDVAETVEAIKVIQGIDMAG